MHCNLRPPEPRQSFSALTTTPCQVWSRWNYPLPYHSVFAANTLLYAVTLTFDHWSWTFAVYSLFACDVMKPCTNFERNRAIRGGLIAILVFDLMTLNIALRVELGSGTIFYQVWPSTTYTCLNYSVLCWHVMSRCNLYLWPVDLLKVRDRWGVNLSEIEQSSAELLIILRIFAYVMSRRDLDLWPLDHELL